MDTTFGLSPGLALALRQLYMVCSASGSSTKYHSLEHFSGQVSQWLAWLLLKKELSARHVAMALPAASEGGLHSQLALPVPLWPAALLASKCGHHGVACSVCLSCQGLHWGGPRTELKKALIEHGYVLCLPFILGCC